METLPLISIVIPVYNRQHLITRTLDSIATQSSHPLELIIVDNESSDTTVEKVNAWIDSNNASNINTIIAHEAEKGAPAARNKGLSMVKTPWVMFFDSDDIMLPGHIDSIIQKIHSGTDADIIYFDIRETDDDNWSTLYSFNGDDIMRGHIFHCALSTQRYVVKTSAILNAGGWNNNCKIWNDLELGLRLLARGHRAEKLTGDAKVNVFHTSDSITGDNYTSRQGLYETTLDIMDSCLDNDIHTLEKSWIECRRMILAAQYSREGLKDRASNIYHNVTSRNPFGTALKLKFIFLVHATFGHGGATLSSILFKRQKQKIS